MSTGQGGRGVERVARAQRQPLKTGELLDCFSLFYLRPEPESWARFEDAGTWRCFIDTIRQLLTDTQASKNPLLQRLSEKAGFTFDLGVLSQAPRFEAQMDFARRHLVGGLPTSVLPIESFYRCWTHQDSTSLAFAHQRGLYHSDAAAHMTSLLERFELTVTGDALLPPDHLAIELSFLAVLLRHGSNADIRIFIDDHLSWLPSYIDTLLDRIPPSQGKHRPIDTSQAFIAITILLNACLERLRETRPKSEPARQPGRMAKAEHRRKWKTDERRSYETEDVIETDAPERLGSHRCAADERRHHVGFLVDLQGPCQRRDGLRNGRDQL
ncbi:MAG: molecular chaperone TorD family protein [Coriobacteriales bacterium]|jgi:hypothetical protein|nr:molecular chaperone TorD family protein [Coriobacteriales bacterium]